MGGGAAGVRPAARASSRSRPGWAGWCCASGPTPTTCHRRSTSTIPTTPTAAPSSDPATSAAPAVRDFRLPSGPAAGRAPARVSARHQLARELRRTHHRGRLAELGRADARERPSPGAGEQRRVVLARLVEEQRRRLRDPTADHHQLGVEDVGDERQPHPEPPREVLHRRARDRVAFPRGRRHALAGHAARGRPRPAATAAASAPDRAPAARPRSWRGPFPSSSAPSSRSCRTGTAARPARPAGAPARAPRRTRPGRARRPAAARSRCRCPTPRTRRWRHRTPRRSAARRAPPRWRRARRRRAARCGAAIRSATGASRHDRCGANRTTRRSGVMNPASASPTAAIRCRSASVLTTPATAASSAVSLGGVGVRAVSSTEPSPLTTPARTLVPPTSTPTVSVTVRHRERRQGARPGSAARSSGCPTTCAPSVRARRISSSAARSSRDEPAEVLGQPLHELGTLPAQRGHQRAQRADGAGLGRHRGGRLDAQPVQHGLDPVERRPRERAQLGGRPGVRVASGGRGRHRVQTAGSGANVTHRSSPSSRAAVTVHRRSTDGSATSRRTPPTATTSSSPTLASSRGPSARAGQGERQLELRVGRRALPPGAPHPHRRGAGRARGRRVGAAVEVVGDLQQRGHARSARPRCGRRWRAAPRRARQLAEDGLLLVVPLAQPARRGPAQRRRRPRHHPVDDDAVDAQPVQGQRGERAPGFGRHHPLRGEDEPDRGARVVGEHRAQARELLGNPSRASIVASQPAAAPRPPPDRPASSPRTARRCAGNSRST